METPIFGYELKVRDYECDAQGIVNNANYQHYYEVARHELMESIGLNFLDLHNKGIDLVVSGISIKYKNSLRGMDRFLCTVEKIEKKGVRYIFHQKIVRISDNLVCSTGEISTVCLIDGKLSRPDYIDQIFADYI